MYAALEHSSDKNFLSFKKDSIKQSNPRKIAFRILKSIDKYTKFDFAYELFNDELFEEEITEIIELLVYSSKIELQISFNGD